MRRMGVDAAPCAQSGARAREIVLAISSARPNAVIVDQGTLDYAVNLVIATRRPGCITACPTSSA